MTRLDGARELARLTAILEDAVSVGDVNAADRVLQARARVLEDADQGPLTPEDAAVLAVIAQDVREREARVRDTLGRAVAETRAALGAITTATTVARAYVPSEDVTPGFVDRRD